jgi:hypothetical protein
LVEEPATAAIRPDCEIANVQQTGHAKFGEQLKLRLHSLDAPVPVARECE